MSRKRRLAFAPGQDMRLTSREAAQRERSLAAPPQYPPVYPYPLMPAPRQERYRSVTVQVITDRNASAAQVSLYQDSTAIAQATGSAKREPGDRYDPAVADGLALGRALIRLGRQLCAEQRGAVQDAAAALEQERQRVISARIRRVERQALQRNHPEHHWMSADQLREKYGPEAAATHLARQARRKKEASQ